MPQVGYDGVSACYSMIHGGCLKMSSIIGKTARAAGLVTCFIFTSTNTQEWPLSAGAAHHANIIGKFPTLITFTKLMEIWIVLIKNNIIHSQNG